MNNGSGKLMEDTRTENTRQTHVLQDSGDVTPYLSKRTTAVETFANHAPRALGARREQLEANGCTSATTATVAFTRSALTGNTCATPQEAQLGSPAPIVSHSATPTWPTATIPETCNTLKGLVVPHGS